MQAISTATATALTPELVFNTMAPGWNLGNQMDAIDNGVSSETAWKNPKCTQATFDGVKAAGFKAVRICVTWEGHIGATPGYQVETKWMDRVAEIVGQQVAGQQAELRTDAFAADRHHVVERGVQVGRFETDMLQLGAVVQDVVDLFKGVHKHGFLMQRYKLLSLRRWTKVSQRS